MSTLCAYENYLRDRYILGEPVRYMYGGFGGSNAGGSTSKPKQTVYGPDNEEYTYVDDPSSPNAGRYARQIGGNGGGKTVFLDDVQKEYQKRQMEEASKAAQPQAADNRQSAKRPAQEKPARRPVRKTWNLTEIEDANGDFLDVQVKASSEDEAKQIVADALKIQRDTRKKAGGGYSWELQEILEWGERNPEKFKQAIEDAKPQDERPQTAPKTEPSAPQTEQVDADSGQHGSKKEATPQSNVDYSEFADAYKRYRAEDKKIASLKRKASKIQKAVSSPSSGATPEEIQSARESLAKIRGEISDSEKVKDSLSSGLNSFTKKHNVVFIDGGDSFVVNPSSELIQGLKQRKSLQDNVKKARKKAEEAKKAGLKTNASEIASIADKLESELNSVNDLLSQMFPNETVVSVVDEKPKRRRANKKKEPQEERAEENAYRNDDEADAIKFKSGDLLFKRNLLDNKTGYGSYRSQPSEYGKADLNALFHALNANDLSYFEDINPADFDNSKKFMVTTRLGDKKEFTARSLFEEIQEESADGDGGFNIYNNADTNNFIDRYKGSKGWPRRFQKIFSETNKEPKLNWQLQLASNTLEDTNYEFARGEFGGDYAPQYLNSVCSLVADLGQSLPPIDADPKIKAGFLNRYLCFLYGSALAAYASDEEGLHRKEADKLAWQFLKAGRGEVTSRLLKKLFNAAEKQGFTSPAIDSPIGINSGVHHLGDLQKKENAPAAQKREPKDVVARDVKSASSPGDDANADSFVEGVETGGFSLPSSESTSPVVKNGSSNKDAAYFIRRDLEAMPKAEVEEGVKEVDEVSEASLVVQKPEPKGVIAREVPQTEKPAGNKKRGRTEEAFPELPPLNGDLQDIAVADEIRRRIHNWAIYTNYFDNKFIPGGYYIDGPRRLYDDEVYRRLFDKKTDARFWIDNEKDILNVLKKELDSGLAKLVNEGWEPSPEQAELADLRYIEGEKFRDTARDNPNKYRSRSSAKFDTASNIRKYADKSLSARNRDEAIQITKKLSSLAYYSATQGDEESTKICKDVVDRLFAKFGKDDYGQLAERQRVTDNHYQRAVNNAAKKRAKEEREAKRRAKEEQKASGDAPKKKRGKKASNVPTAQKIIESETATLERAPLDSAGLGLPGSQDSVLDASEGDNRDAAYFIRRDLGEESPSNQNAQEAPVATPEPTRQEQPAKPRPERWTPLKSKMNDDDKRVVENTRKRLNYGLSELAWRLGNAKEKGDVQRVKQLVATAANHYLEQARRAYRSHGGTEALAAFDEALGGDGLTVGQLRDRIVDKFRKIAQMEANDLFKFAGERLDEFESFTEADNEPISNKEIHLNSIRDKNGKWEGLGDKDSEVMVEDGKPTTLFPDEHFGRRMGSERGLADAVRRALKSMTRKGEYRDSFENDAEYADPKYNIDTPTRMGRFLAHGYKDSLGGKPVSRDDYSEQRYQELLKKFPTDRESRKLNDLFKSNNREVNKLIKENEDEYKQSKNKSEVAQRVVDGIRDILSRRRQNGSVEAPFSESLRSGTAGEVLETGGADRLSDGGDGRDYASVITEEAKKSDIPESRVREELSLSTNKSPEKTSPSSASSPGNMADWERELEEMREFKLLEDPILTRSSKRGSNPNAAQNAKATKAPPVASSSDKTEVSTQAPGKEVSQTPSFIHTPTIQQRIDAYLAEQRAKGRNIESLTAEDYAKIFPDEGQRTNEGQTAGSKNKRGRPRVMRPDTDNTKKASKKKRKS